MGGAVSAATREKRLTENTVVTLDQAHQHMRIYQHRGNGEILVLIDEDIMNMAGIRHTDWDLLKVNSRQQEYFRKVKVDVEIPAKNVHLVASTKDSLPPRSPNIAESKTETTPPHYGSSANTVLTPSGISTPSSSKNPGLNSSNSNSNSSNGSLVAGHLDYEAGAKLSTSASMPESLGIAQTSGSKNKLHNNSGNNGNSNNNGGLGAKQGATSASTGDLLHAEERMKMTLTSLKAAAVSDHSSRITAEAKHSPRGPNLSSSINSFSSFDANESKFAAPVLVKSLFADEVPRRRPGDRRRFEPKPYFPPSQRALNDRSLEELNSQSQSSWSQSQSQSQSFSQSAGVKEDISGRSFHSVGSEKLFSSGFVSTSEQNTNNNNQSNNSTTHTGSEPLSVLQQQHFHFQQLLLAGTANKQEQCVDCGRVFLGSTAAEALRDHSLQCAERQIMKQAFSPTDAALLQDLQELAQLESYEHARAFLPRMTRSLDDLARRFRSYLVQYVIISTIILHLVHKILSTYTYSFCIMISLDIGIIDLTIFFITVSILHVSIVSCKITYLFCF